MIGQRPLFQVILTMILVLAGWGGVASADVVTIIASRDNTLIESSTGGWSGGTMPWIFAGNTNQIDAEDTRRALLRFDLAAIPIGSTVNSASVRLRMTKSVLAGTHTFTLHRMLADWGEGSSGGTGGAGSMSTAGSATWLHRFYPGVAWTTDGGDYVSPYSAQVSVGGLNFYTWTSAQLAADVQAWINNPATNCGWMLKGNESVAVSAKRFDSHETSADGDKPALTLNYTPPPEYGGCCLGDICVLAAPASCTAMQGIYKGDGSTCAQAGCCRGDVDLSGAVNVTDLLAVINAWGACQPPPEACPADVVINGEVDVLDLLAVLNNWGPCS